MVLLMLQRVSRTNRAMSSTKFSLMLTQWCYASHDLGSSLMNVRREHQLQLISNSYLIQRAESLGFTGTLAS